MPFEIVRNDIVKMQVDAIVNTANPDPIVGTGVDSRIHKAAGPQLLEARKKIGVLREGEAAVTRAFGLDARYVIHVSGPVWHGGDRGETELLRKCYLNALLLAKKNKCESIAFPLISTGNYGFPKEMAMQVALSVFSEFLMRNDMHIYLVVFGEAAVAISQKLFQSVKQYIDNEAARDILSREYGVAGHSDPGEARRQRMAQTYEEYRRRSRADRLSALDRFRAAMPEDWQDLLENLDAGFAETLLKLIDRSGMTDPEVYRKANVDRRVFSKIRSSSKYMPSKTTAVAFALALELTLEETQDLLGRAGFTLSDSRMFDLVVKFFIGRREYDIMEINQVLFYFDQPLIGAG